MTSKLHGVCDSKGGPLRLHLREGQCSDFTGADVLRKGLPPAATVIGDKGTVTKSVRCWPSRASRLASRPVAAARNQSITARGRIARVTKSRRSFPDSKDWRRSIAIRYDRCAHVFRSAILLAATVLF